jgi:hypothetical protein
VGSVQAIGVAARRDADLRAVAYAGACFGRQSGGDTWKGSRSSRRPACSTCRPGRVRVLCRRQVEPFTPRYRGPPRRKIVVDA